MNSKVGEILGGLLSEKCFRPEDAEYLVEAMWIANLLMAFAKDTLSLSQLAHSSLSLVCFLSNLIRTSVDLGCYFDSQLADRLQSLSSREMARKLTFSVTQLSQIESVVCSPRMVSTPLPPLPSCLLLYPLNISHIILQRSLLSGR